jgi:hypothetical protein
VGSNPTLSANKFLNKIVQGRTPRTKDAFVVEAAAAGLDPKQCDVRVTPTASHVPFYAALPMDLNQATDCLRSWTSLVG